MEQTRQLAVAISERFTQRVLSEIAGNNAQNFKVTEEQRRLVQGYYMGCDNALRNAGQKWENVNIDAALAGNIVKYMRVGIDMSIENSLWVIPRQNRGKVDLTFQLGYEGRKQVAKRYSLSPIEDIRDELIYSTDKFKIIKRDAKHPVESYEFEVTNPFNRGTLIGGFVYVEFQDSRKNFVFTMSKAEIDKRKSKAQTTKVWDDWYDAMARKTIIHAACRRITIDPKLIDQDYKAILREETAASEANANAEIEANANNGEVIDVMPDVPYIPPDKQEEAQQQQQEAQTEEPANQTAPAPQQGQFQGGLPF